MAAACSGIVLGAVSCLSFYDPISVHADFADLAGVVDYIESLSGEEAVALGSSTGGAAVAGALLGVWMCTQNPLQLGQYYDMDILTTYTCFYRWNGETKLAFVNVYSASNFTSDSGGYDLITSDDFDIRVETSAPATVSSELSSGQVNVGVLNQNAAGVQRWWDTKLHFDQVLSNNNYGNWGYWGRFGLADLGSTPPDYYSYSGAFPVTFSYSAPLYPVVLDLAATSVGLGDELDVSNPELYIDNVVRPWVVDNYPEYIYLLPEPQPEPPQYDTDVVTGIPKEWTITNPQLPTSPHFELTVPDGDFEEIDPGDTFTGFSSGVGFWWAMVNQVLTTFHIKALALALLAVAVAIFALYKIGG